MRIKFDGNLFSREDMDCLTQKLKEKGIDMQLIPKNSATHKGIIDTAAIGSWITIIATAFLPVIVDIVYSYIKEKKEKAKINIELKKADGSQKKITIPSNQPYSSLEIEVSEEDDVRIFITKD